jgi:hypothetical protein
LRQSIHASEHAYHLERDIIKKISLNINIVSSFFFGQKINFESSLLIDLQLKMEETTFKPNLSNPIMAGKNSVIIW